MKKIALHWQIIIGLILGIVWALLSSTLGWSQFTIDWIAPFGKIFINLLKLIAVPLVLFSIINGVSSIGDPKSLGRMGGKTLAAYLVTTVIAVSLGLLLVNLIKPGKLIDEQSRIDNRIGYEVWAADNNVEIKDGIRIPTLFSFLKQTIFKSFNVWVFRLFFFFLFLCPFKNASHQAFCVSNRQFFVNHKVCYFYLHG